MDPATHEGVTVESNTQTAEQVRASLGWPAADTPPAAPEPKIPAELPITEKPAEPKTEVEKQAASEHAQQLNQRKKGLQARIDELSGQLANREQHISVLYDKLAKVETLEKDLAALKAGPPAKPIEPDTPKKPTWAEFEAQGKSYDDFLEAKDAWTLAEAERRAERKYQELSAADRERIDADQAARASAERGRAFQDRLAKARETHADFDAIVSDGPELSRPMRDVIIESPVGPELMLHLAQHPEDADRIRGLHPIHALREMGKLEERIDAAAKGSAAKPQSVSQAKPPTKPIASSPQTVTDGPPGDDRPIEEHIAYYNALEAKQRARR